MDKTISISLGGYSFIIDDAAYLKLKKYLDDVRRSLKGMEGTEDVLSDVEIRIAELFRERLNHREVVGETDVDHIIQVMGKPEQYMDEEEPGNESRKNSGYTATGGKKKLYRDADNKVLGGVLSGIAHYIGIESWITRVIWILLFFADIPLTGTSFTIISYIILWIILPKAETVTQKYEMMGEAGDIASIKKSVGSTSETGKKVHSTSDTFTEALKIFGKIILVFLGFIFICIGLSLVFSGIFTLVFATAGDVPVQIFGRFFDHQWQDISSKVIILILLGVPGMLMTWLGAKMISNRVKINKVLVLGSLGLWLAALIFGGVLTASAFKSFARNAEFTEKNDFTPTKDTITLKFNEFKQSGKKNIKWNFEFNPDVLTEIDGKLYRKIDKNIEIRKSDDDQVSVRIVYSSKGSTVDNARQYAEKINYNYSMNTDGELVFDNYIELPKDTRFRNQDVSLVVYIPEGKVIHSTNIKYLNFSEENSNARNIAEGIDKFYKFADNHYECLNCKTNSETAEDDSAKIKVDGSGIKVHDGDNKVEINKDKIKISDGTDSIDISLGGN